MFFLIFFCTLLSALIKFDITSQDLDTKRLLYPENDASVDKITVTKSFNLESCTWDDSPSYAALFGLQQNICFFSHANSKQVASQFISEATPRADNLKLVETNVRTSTEERDSLVNLPPLEDAAVGDMEQNPIPTFNEFHAMLSEVSIFRLYSQTESFFQIGFPECFW
ncbi:unnamed protein product [Dicrocoelium dendriticum]|nr:unnamed protein product [Dicrocoelium dendriticum]